MNIFERAAAIIAEKTLVHSFVEDQVKEQRLAVCNGCDRLDQESRRCKICKCFVDAKTKAETNYNPIRLRNEITHCPNGYWGDIEIANHYREIDGLSPL